MCKKNYALITGVDTISILLMINGNDIFLDFIVGTTLSETALDLWRRT
jgi:hypothetical protein